MTSTSMKQKAPIEIPEAISSRLEYKHKFSFQEMYRAFVLLPSSIVKLLGNRRKKLVDDDFVERLQLAITEVSGCAACSYAHTKMALRQGMSGDEISSFLSGEDSYISPEEAKGIMFAQHFADTAGHPEQYAYDSILDEYGEEEAAIILSAARVMIAGNIYGLAYSALESRRAGKPFSDSSLFYELGMLITGVLAMPAALVHGVVSDLLGIARWQKLARS